MSLSKTASVAILDIAATQFEDGNAYHQYQPLTKKGNMDIGAGFNDDPLWLIAAVSAYVRETGNLSILDEQVDFNNDHKLAQPLMEHLRRSYQYTLNHRGPHGLPLIGRADWNDCLNLNCFSKAPGESFQTSGPSEGPVAESVFIGGMFVKYANEYADLCDATHHTNEAIEARAAARNMSKALLGPGWDGAWFELTRVFRGATYHITVDNSAHVEKGVKSVTVNGKPIQGSVLPLAKAEEQVEVRVVLNR